MAAAYLRPHMAADTFLESCQSDGWRIQEDLGEIRKNPAEYRRNQVDPGGFRKNQENPGGRPDNTLASLNGSRLNLRATLISIT